MGEVWVNERNLTLRLGGLTRFNPLVGVISPKMSGEIVFSLIV